MGADNTLKWMRGSGYMALVSIILGFGAGLYVSLPLQIMLTGLGGFFGICAILFAIIAIEEAKQEDKIR